METQVVDGIEINMGMTNEYFGAQADSQELPEMGNAQMVASLILSKFSIPQIKKLMPEIRNVSGAVLSKMVFDTSSRAIRKDFIESLKGNMPRQLTVSETVKVIKAVGQPNSKIQMGNLQKILDKITLDMEHVDLIVQAKNTKAANVQTRETVIEAIAKTERSIKRSDDKIRSLDRKLSSARETLVNNPEDQVAKYNATKIEFNRIDADSMRSRSVAKLEDLKEVLAKFDNSEQNQDQ
ncbi:MAG: hypothetical protein WCX48_12030 [Bacteroidales bacterium]